MFTRYAPDDRFPYDEFDIYTIRPDGTDLTRLTDAEGNDAHSLWSPDGNFILFSSSRFGYKDESPLVLNQPQPYAELFIMNADGSNQRPLTDNQYEEGTQAWLTADRLKQERRRHRAAKAVSSPPRSCGACVAFPGHVWIRIHDPLRELSISELRLTFTTPG